MPIQGLTDRRQGFPPIGELRKGGPQMDRDGRKVVGADLGEFFRFTSRDPEVVRRFGDIYGTKPTAISCLLVGARTDDALDAWNELYTAGALIHRCDADRLVYRRRGQVTERWALGEGPQCEFAHLPGDAKDERGKPVNRCRPHARLKILPVVIGDDGRVQMADLGRVGQVLVLTTSLNDVVRLSHVLRMYESLNGSLAGVPFILSRVEEQITQPGRDGVGRVRAMRHLLDLTPDPKWVSLQLEAARRRQFADAADTVGRFAPHGSAALPEGGRYGVVEDGDHTAIPDDVDFETGEIVEPPPPAASTDDTPLAEDPIWTRWREAHALALASGMGVRQPPENVTRQQLEAAIRAVNTAVAKRQAARS